MKKAKNRPLLMVRYYGLYANVHRGKVKKAGFVPGDRINFHPHLHFPVTEGAKNPFRKKLTRLGTEIQFADRQEVRDGSPFGFKGECPSTPARVESEELKY
ncbi:MAG: hypothetical protein NTU60_11245 [Candidatus Aminicenantes bacterium]|nr:hypothetical protein [Candidatus Aminicenantes bacterium]